MEVIVNYPTTKEGVELFEDKFAEFQARVVIETIRNLDIDYTSKKKVLEGLLKGVNELESESDILEQTLNNKN